jgi:hypothetical protein
MDYLEAPTPYIMGIHSCNADFQYLKEIFPEHIIVDVDTSQIFCKNLIELPALEQSRLRRKLQFVKNPEIFELEEIMADKIKKTFIEDIYSERTFSTNIQYIFFRCMRKVFGNFQKKFMQGHIFDEERFLEELVNEEEKLFWGKIIHTSAFENFILADQTIDDSPTKVFKKIVKNDNDEIYIHKPGLFCIGVNYHTSYMLKIYTNLLEDFKKQEPNEQINRHIQILEKLILDLKLDTSSETKIKKRNYSNELNESVRFLEAYNQTSPLKKSLYMYNPEACFKANKVSKKILKFYGKKGFFSFIEIINEMVKTCEIFNSIYKETILAELLPTNEEEKTDCPNITLKRFNSRISKIEELDSESEIEPSRNTLISEIVIDSRNSVYSELGLKLKPRKEVHHYLFDINNTDCCQYYSLIAIYLDNLQQKDRKEEIIKHYTLSYKANKREFPYFKFYTYLNNFSLDSLQSLQFDNKVKS